jgi:microtubule-associated protein-like 6
VDRSKNKKLIVTADDFGKVNLYRYPCVQKKASANEYRGHASHVMNARWTVNDEYVVTVGGNDRCIMEWKLIDPMVDANTQKKKNLASREKEKEKKQEQEQEQEVGQENDIPEEIEEETIIVPRSSNAASFEVIMKEENGDEFMAIRPWIGAIVSPTNVPIPNAKEPDLKLQLEWIYGYQSEFSKENLRYNAKGEIIYHTAAVGIIYEKKYHLQKFHFGHSDDISCLAISNNGELIATGEKGKRPCIRIWDAHTGAFKSELKHFHTRGIHCLNFDEQNQRLVSIGEDDDHSIALWEDPSGGNTWNNTGKLVASSKGEKNQSKFALIQTKTNNQQQEILIYTGGIKHFNVSRIQGKILTNKKGKFGKKGTIQDLPCGVIFSTSTNNPSKDQNQSVVVTGTASGELYIWQGDALIKAIKAHDPNTAVNALYVHEKQQILLSGGKDGKILIWNRQLIQIQMLNLTNEMILNKSIQSVCMSENGKIVLVGTASSDIVELDATNGTIIDGKPLFSGHFQHELWGLSVHPNCHSFTTTGDDRTLRVWDMETRQMHAITKLANKARACAYSPDGNLLGIGLGGDIGTRMAGKKNPKEGAIAILEMKSLKQVFEDRPAKEWISDVKFSPDGKTIAFGSHDNGIHLYTVENQGTSYKKRKPFHKHNSYITHLDFSKDSKYLQVSYKINFRLPLGSLTLSYLYSPIVGHMSIYSVMWRRVNRSNQLQVSRMSNGPLGHVHWAGRYKVFGRNVLMEQISMQFVLQLHVLFLQQVMIQEKSKSSDTRVS